MDLGWRQLKIGRGPQNDIVLDDPEKAVSRFHAEVRREGDDYVFIDLNSQNGTWVDAQRIDRVAMRVGVPVAIGPYLFVLDGGSDRGTGEPVDVPGTFGRYEIASAWAAAGWACSTAATTRCSIARSPSR